MNTRHLRIAVFMACVTTAVLAGATEKQTILYNFVKQSPSGWAPQQKLVMDKAGNMYGAASEGGVSTQCCGVIFELSPMSGGGWNYQVIYTFSGSGDGAFPHGSLAIDGAGNLYGSAAGSSGGVLGEFFELSPDGFGGWTEKVLYTLTSNDGAPASPLVIDAAGNLYGVVLQGGTNTNGYVFQLSPGSVGAWTFQHIFEFNGTNGSVPVGGVTLDAAGHLFGTTAQGGSTNCPNGCGVVFELAQQSGAWNEKVIFRFNGANGSNSQAPLVIDAAGNLYGTTIGGGAYGMGVVFELAKLSGVWWQRILHSFTNTGGDGSSPDTGLIFQGGDLFGTTRAGGGFFAGCQLGCGSAYQLSPSGGTWKETILHDFTGGSDGAFPSGLILDSNHNAFGVALQGGQGKGGVIFELSSTE